MTYVYMEADLHVASVTSKYEGCHVWVQALIMTAKKEKTSTAANLYL